MTIQYDIPTLFEIAFGVKGIYAYRSAEINRQQQPSAINYTGITVIESASEATRLSYLGTPILFPLKFTGATYNVYSPTGEMTTKALADFELPATTLVTFRRAKVISKTKALAAKGTVKELYGFSDWSIDIQGLCLNDPSHPQAKEAAAQLERLLEWEQVADSIEVTGLPFQVRDIYRLAIEEIDTPQVKGKPNVLPFYLRCSSDEPLELIL